MNCKCLTTNRFSQDISEFTAIDPIYPILELNVPNDSKMIQCITSIIDMFLPAIDSPNNLTPV